MRITISSLLAAAAMCLLSQPGPAQEEKRPQGQDQQRELFERLDANKDGQITADEVPEERKGLFDRLVRNNDKNGDGKISKEEFAAASTPAERRPAAEGDQPRRPGQPGGFEPANMFRVLDKNGDGKIVLDEVPEERRDMIRNAISRGDKDGDSALNLDEFRAALAAFGGQPGRPGEGGRPNPANAPFFRAIDSNGDGKLSGDELATAGEALKKLDKNGDGFLTPEELIPPGPPGPPPGSSPAGAPPAGEFAQAMLDRLKQSDANGDGKLSKDEAPDRLKENFDRIDSNSDGFLDKAELGRAFARLRPNQGDGTPPRRRPGNDKKEESKKEESKEE